MMKEKVAYAALAGLAATLAPGMAAAADRTGTVQVGKQRRSFSIHVPDGPAPRGGFPVVLAFHGGGMQGAGMQRITQLDAVSDNRRVILLYPDGVDKHWNDGRSTIRNPQDDIGFVSALLDQVQRDYRTDPTRVFATGISNGALFAERVGCELSHRVRAIAPVAGSMPTDLMPVCKPKRPVAVLQIDGTADPIMPYGGGNVKDFGGKGEGGKVTAVADTASFWARANGCGPRGAPQSLPPVVARDRTRIVRTSFSGCPAAAPVTVLTVVGGGHAWPGGAQRSPPAIIGTVSGQLDASRGIVAYFLGLPPR